jgi:hypothetical protein
MTRREYERWRAEVESTACVDTRLTIRDRPGCYLTYDPKREMGYPRGFDHPRTFQLDRPRSQMVEQSDAVPEQDGHQVHVYLVEESGPDALLGDAC